MPPLPAGPYRAAPAAWRQAADPSLAPSSVELPLGVLLLPPCMFAMPAAGVDAMALLLLLLEEGLGWTEQTASLLLMSSAAAACWHDSELFASAAAACIAMLPCCSTATID